ncbi:hypothetical protein [Spiroplasma poulsonii]|nr:hypothetical protein [Spiroplasma poulsonii]UNF62130.1 hypothetical protein MNU24_01305 [Spiroplasma poulsonii]
MNLLILRVLTLLVSNLENKPLISKLVNLINKVYNPLQKITNKVEDIYQ